MQYYLLDIEFLICNKVALHKETTYITLDDILQSVKVFQSSFPILH